jgi:hypothetical protein
MDKACEVMTHNRPSGERDQRHRIVCAVAEEFRDDGSSVAIDGDCDVPASTYSIFSISTVDKRPSVPAVVLEYSLPI